MGFTIYLSSCPQRLRKQSSHLSSYLRVSTVSKWIVSYLFSAARRHRCVLKSVLAWKIVRIWSQMIRNMEMDIKILYQSNILCSCIKYCTDVFIIIHAVFVPKLSAHVEWESRTTERYSIIRYQFEIKISSVLQFWW